MKSKDQQLLEEAYKKTIVNEEHSDQEFSYYSGPAEDVMFLDDMDPSNLKRKMEEGKTFKTAYVAKREDAATFGYKPEPGHEYYVFYTPQDFTHPALIPV